MSFTSLTMFASLAALTACSALPPPPIGQLELGLSSGIGEQYYRLTGASFAIDGAVQLTLESDEDPASEVLQRALPEGDYSVRLLDGWRLERVGPSGSDAVVAELASENPIPFSILAGALTTVTFQFRTLGGEPLPAGGSGDVRVAIEVDGESSPHVIFSELMKNPEVLPDADGEWIELYNAGAQALDIGGCTLTRDAQEVAIEGSLVVEPGAHLTFANSATPGFTPDVIYGGLSLPNSGSFLLRLTCGGRPLDEVAVDATVPAQRPGRSLSLSATALDDLSNDDPERWCEGTQSYDGDFGTPGAENPRCPS